MAYRNQHRGDEFYTQREDVENILEQYLPELTAEGVRVLCPCDTDESEFVRYLTEKGVDVTWSNDLCYQQFDFSEYTYIITNPPFSLMADFLTRIADSGRGGLVVMPFASISGKAAIRLMNSGWRVTDEGAPKSFRRPDGSSRQVSTVLLHSFERNIHLGELKRSSRSLRPPVMTDEGIVRYNYTCDVPESWDGVIAVPVSWAAARFDPTKHYVARGDLHVGGKHLFASLVVTCTHASEQSCPNLVPS